MTDQKDTQSDAAFNYPPLPKPKGRFNDWGERKWITVSENKLEIIGRQLAQLKLTPRAQALYEAAQFTDSEGVEFVFISNAQFPGPVIFQSTGVHIVPCFVPLRLIPGGPSPSEDRQAAMMKRGQYIYDGWVPNMNWTTAGIEQIVSMLDDLVNIFSIVGKYYAFWQPKYYFAQTTVPSYLIFPDEFASLAQTMGIIDSLFGTDKVAVSRSTAWIADALRDESPVQRFLLLFLSIEALATYIERESEQNSPLFQFAADRLTKAERKQRRETCITDVLASDLEPIAAIQRAYFDCVVGTRKMLEEHLNRIFGDDQASKALFYEAKAGKTLWTLRNEIAHGSLNILQESDIRLVADQVRILEDVARNYLRTVLAKLAPNNF